MAGEVVGITTLYLKGGENLNFAIPVNDAKLLLSTGSKVQDFPVETEAAKSETHAEAAPSPSMSPSTARAYYKQLYDAGGFKFELNNFVCFNERPESSLQWFFTFSIIGYDERYAKAAKAHVEALLDKTNDDTEAWHTMRSIEASNPNVYFQDDDSMSIIDAVFGAGTEAYLRGGGQVLTYTPYDKGVKIGDVYYRRAGGDLWTRDDKPSNSLIQTEKTSLSFEPTTLRYVMRLVTTFTDGSTVVNEVVSGMCEKIPAKQSASNTKERSPTEVFNLRSQCAQLGKAIDEWSTHDKTELQSVVSNYSVKDNRCYVDLRFLVLSGEMAGWDDNTLYDGQTREALAYTMKEGRTGRSGIADKTGGILVSGHLDMPDECFKTPPNTDEALKQAGDCSFDKANAYIDERMKRDDQ